MLKTGVLRRGFTVNSRLFKVKIPAGTKVAAEKGVVTFDGLDVQIFKVNGFFAAYLWGVAVYLEPFEEAVPYPVVMIA